MMAGERGSDGLTDYERALQDFARNCADDGKLIEAGWYGLQAAWIPPAAPQHQVDDLRKAFMAGAQHLFASVMQILDPGDEPTEADLARMALISAELEAFGRKLAEDLPTKGSA